jgi:hypothetical protein
MLFLARRAWPYYGTRCRRLTPKETARLCGWNGCARLHKAGCYRDAHQDGWQGCCPAHCRSVVRTGIAIKQWLFIGCEASGLPRLGDDEVFRPASNANTAGNINWSGLNNERVDDRAPPCGGVELSGRRCSHAGRTRAVQRRACSDDETGCGTGLAGFAGHHQACHKTDRRSRVGPLEHEQEASLKPDRLWNPVSR